MVAAEGGMVAAEAAARFAVAVVVAAAVEAVEPEFEPVPVDELCGVCPFAWDFVATSDEPA